MDSSVLQLNVTYHPEQDRLLLRIALAGDKELLLWLTRSVTKLCWTLLQELSQAAVAEISGLKTDPMQREIMQDFAREAVLQKLDFSEPYHEQRTNLLQNPLLIQDVTLKRVGDGAKSLELKALNGQLIALNLNTELTLGLCQVLALLTEKAEWGLGLSLASSDARMHTASVKH